MCLLLAVCMVLTLMPTTALAGETESARSSKTVITTVQELQQFAEAVNRGDYDAKTDAVVSLEADLDMTGIAWTPIGCADDNGAVKHFFSGKFYGNGHTISNFDFSSSYGIKAVGGFFGYIENAEVFSLKIQGNLDVVCVFGFNLRGFTWGRIRRSQEKGRGSGVECLGGYELYCSIIVLWEGASYCILFFI